MTRRIRTLARRAQRSRLWSWAALGQVLLVNLFLFWSAPRLHADDCSKDFRRAEDCLRTPGYAQGIATTAGIIGSVLINGLTITQILIKPRGPAQPAGENPPDKQYFLDVQTTPNPLSLTPDGKAAATVFAQVRCSDPTVATAPLTSSISLTLGGAGAGLAQAQDGSSGGYRYLTCSMMPPAAGQVAGNLSVTVLVYVEGTPLSCTIPIPLGTVPGDLVTLINPEGQVTLTPGGNDQVWIYAKVNLPEDVLASGAIDVQAVKQTIRFTVLGADGWVASNEPAETGEWMAWLCQLTGQPASGDGTTVPGGFTVRVTATLGGQPLQKDLPFKIQLAPVMWTKPPTSVYLLSETGMSEEVTVWLENPGETKWAWRAAFEEGNEAFATAAIVATANPALITLTLTEAHVKVAEGEIKYSKVTIYAEDAASGTRVTGSVPIEVGREGIVLLKEGMVGDAFPVNGDGKQEKTRFCLRVMAWDKQRRELTASEKLPPGVEFELTTTDAFPRKLATFGQMAPAFQRMALPDGQAAGEYTIFIAKPLPLEMAEPQKVTFRASVLTDNNVKLSCDVTFSITYDQKAAESRVKDEEIRQCYYLIEKYVFDPTRKAELRKIVDERKDALGVEGLFQLRRMVWFVARDLLMAEAKTYEDQAEWYERAITICEWSEWAGDLAFGAVVSTFTGPVGTLVASTGKGAIVSAINCYRTGGSIDEWAMQQLGVVPGLIEGQIVDPDRIAEFLQKRAGRGAVAAAWTAFFGYHFGRALYGGKSLVEAVKYAAGQCRDTVLGAWLCTKCHAAARPGGQQATDGATTPKAEPDAPPKPTSEPETPPKPASEPEPPRKPTSEADTPPKPISEPDTTLKPKPEPEAPRVKEPTTTADGEPSSKPKSDGEATLPPDGQKPPESKADDRPRAGDEPKVEDRPKTDEKPKADDEPKTDDKPKADDEPKIDEKPKTDDKSKPSKPYEPPPHDVRKEAWQKGQHEGNEKFDKATDAVKSQDPQKVRDAALDVQQNKQSLYEGNRKTGPEAAETRTALKDEMKKIYGETDKQVCDRLGEKYPGAEGPSGPNVRVKEVTNPARPNADPTKMSIDRDVTYQRRAQAGEIIPDPNKPGSAIKAKGDEWVDIPTKESSAVYHDEFKKAALDGASPETKAQYENMSPEEFARLHDQSVTDKLSSDAYGSRESDLKTATENPAGTFNDPAGVGKTAEFKANEWYQKAETEAQTPVEHETYVAEGMRQTTKQYGNQVEKRLDVLNANRGGEGQPPKVEPPPELKKGVEILKEVTDGKTSPADAEARLRDIGMTKRDVSNKLGAFIEKIYRMPVNT